MAKCVEFIHADWEIQEGMLQNSDLGLVVGVFGLAFLEVVYQVFEGWV